MKPLSRSTGRGDGEGARRLDRAVRLTRESAPGPTALSAATRSRIVDAALSASRTSSEPLPALFAPARRLAVAGVLPVLLAAVFLGTLGTVDRTVQPDPEGPARLAVSKQGDQITFSIANGGTPHTVYRSTSPERFDPSAGVRVADGRFVDRVKDDATIVFYRID